MDEKKAKGLCFWCNERFTLGHKCGNKQFHRLEVRDDSGEKDEGETEVEECKTDEGKLAHMSINAISSMVVPNFRTMRVTRHMGKQSINVFINYGTSHNFIHPNVVQKLGLVTQKVELLVVEVADGNKLTTHELCPNFLWKMQGQTFRVDILVLPLGGASWCLACNG